MPDSSPPPSIRGTPGSVAQDNGELARLLVDSVEDYAIFALDAQGYIISWNAGAARLKGYTAEEIIGQHFSVFYPKERVEEGFPAYELREAARVGRFEDEGWRIRKDGSRFWANVVITALHNADGELVGFAKVTRDLTDRRLAEEELRASEERFRLMVQSVRDYAIFMLDPTGHIATWNDGARRIKGYTADEIIGRHFSIFYTPEDLATRKPARELEIATATGVYEEEGWRVRKDGSRFWASVVITALRMPNGTLAGFGKVTRDLTERRAAQQRALEDARRVAAEEAARQLADANRRRTEQLQELTAALSQARTIPEVAAIVIQQGLRTVGAAAGSLGLVEDSGETVRLVGEMGLEPLPDWVRRVAVSDEFPMGVAVHTGKPVVFRSRAERDARFPRMAPILAPYESTVVLPLAARGRTVGALAMHRTASAPLTDPVLEFMIAFGQQAGVALERALLYEAEQQARARADEANRVKTEFLAAMSHELRTPLNAIAGYADLMDMGVRGPVTAEQREDLHRIKRSQQHLLGIINDILNFSRVEAGQVSYEYESVRLDLVLEHVSQMIVPQTTARGLQFIVTSCPDNAVVWADRAKVQQVLLNLLSNAVKFTLVGGVTLSCESGHGHLIRLTVRDTGIGIAEEALGRIFEPFVQVGRSLTSSGEGTGLGLAISRDLARSMGGDITVESKVGVGSSFTLLLPTAAEYRLDLQR